MPRRRHPCLIPLQYSGELFFPLRAIEIVELLLNHRRVNQVVPRENAICARMSQITWARLRVEIGSCCAR
jgi:hypothetical protein